MMRISGWTTALACAASLAACGGGGGGGAVTQSLPPGFYVKIQNMTFDPTELAVPPGATVTVVNMDAVDHSATSEAAANDFTPGSFGGVSFDTGTFASSTRTFPIPATGLTDGTHVPYYCKVHTSLMSPANPTIRIDSTAQPSVPSWAASTTTGGMGGM